MATKKQLQAKVEELEGRVHVLEQRPTTCNPWWNPWAYPIYPYHVPYLQPYPYPGTVFIGYATEATTGMDGAGAQ